MMRLYKTLRNRIVTGTRQQVTDAAPGESDDEGGDQTSLPAGYVRPEGPGTAFSGKQTVISELFEAWRRRKSRPSSGR
jgi:hypothetical protein